VRFVEFSPKAEDARTRAPIAIRRRLADAIRAIAEQPAWGDSPTRFVAPAHSPNSGLIADLSVLGWAIIYRVRSSDDVVWIEDIRQVVIG
jgi:mRNA-degrading endonuclease RelE of RelBE toxin-antitoxin system